MLNELSVFPPDMLDPFRGVPAPYEGLGNAVVKDDACALSAEAVREMPLNSIATYVVERDDQQYPLQVTKMASRAADVTVNLQLVNDSDYWLRAYIRSQWSLARVFRDAGFVNELLKVGNVVAGFDLQTKADGERHPVFRAKAFLPWALAVLEYYGVTHLLAEWEPDSDNHAVFYRALRHHRGKKIASVRETWTHEQFTALGFTPNTSVHIYDAMNGKVSPFGCPATAVNVLYHKKRVK